MLAQIHKSVTHPSQGKDTTQGPTWVLIRFTFIISFDLRNDPLKMQSEFSFPVQQM